MQRKKINLILTREKDENLGLRERARIANNNEADLYLSLHFNGFHTPPSAYGVEALINNTDNKNEEFAKIIVDKAYSIIGSKIKTKLRHHTGVKQMSLGALRGGTTMPSTLLESEFITYPAADKLFSKESFLKEYAKGLSEGLLEALEKSII